jgi:hypothetical protein
MDQPALSARLMVVLGVGGSAGPGGLGAVQAGGFEVAVLVVFCGFDRVAPGYW